MLANCRTATREKETLNINLYRRGQGLVIGVAVVLGCEFMGKKRKRLRGTVEKIIQPKYSSEPEKAQIGIHGAEDLYREIRVENALTDDKGEETRLKPGAEVDIVVEAESDAMMKKPEKL